MSKTLRSGFVPFRLDVPFKLLESGSKGQKPLIIYLHGYKQYIIFLEKKMKDMFSVDAYHLFLQGPYPVYDQSHTRRIERWGRAWYLYDGKQEQFIASMEQSSIFIEHTLEELGADLEIRRTVIMGYSMGGYLAGYFALSRPHIVDDMIVMGGRIKTEHFKDNRYDGLRVLDIHGSKDKVVDARLAKDSCKQLIKMGASVTFKEVEVGHALSSAYVQEAKKWLLTD